MIVGKEIEIRSESINSNEVEILIDNSSATNVKKAVVTFEYNKMVSIVLELCPVAFKFEAPAEVTEIEVNLDKMNEYFGEYGYELKKID